MKGGKNMKVQLRKRMKWLGMSILAFLLTMLFAGSALAIDEETINRMEKIIQQQQVQIEVQSRAIQELQQQVQELSKIQKQQAVTAASAGQAATAPPAVVSSSGDKVGVKLYGQVNRAFLYSDDGNSAGYYFVDNDHSSSRMGLLASVMVNDDVTVGSKMEFEYQQNPSNLVNQNNKHNVGGDSFDDRHIEAYVKSQKFGTLSLGKGDTASNNISEIDLSGTAVIGYSDPNVFSGGIIFYDNNAGSLSNVKVSDVFNNFDGLSRDDRIRYDSPVFSGFMASTSATSGDGGDLALRYNSKLGDFKIAAGVAWANPNNEDGPADVDSQLSGSASILHSSGFNLTLTAGQLDYDLSGRDAPTFYYAKLGYRKGFFSVGESRFSIDYAANYDVNQNNDEAKSFGLQFVQDFSKWGTEYYLGYRNYDLDRSGEDFDSINSVMSGLRVKF
jgi:hypothetical protein